MSALMTEAEASRVCHLMVLNYMREVAAGAMDGVQRAFIQETVEAEVNCQADIWTLMRVALVELTTTWLAMCAVTGKNPVETMQLMVLDDAREAAEG